MEIAEKGECMKSIMRFVISVTLIVLGLKEIILRIKYINFILYAIKLIQIWCALIGVKYSQLRKESPFHAALNSETYG